MAKRYAAYMYEKAMGTKRDRLTVVFFKTKDQAEIEKERMKMSVAANVGYTTRTERPRVIMQHLLHRWPGSAYYMRYIRA